jgi:hypothetical protein
MNKLYEPERVREAVPSEPIPSEVRAQFLRPGELPAIQEKFPVVFQPVGTVEWQNEPNLAISSDFPVSQATAEEGRLRFNLQVEGLARLVQDRLKRLF